VLYDEITLIKSTEAGFELSNFNREYHLLGLIDGHGKTYTTAYAYCVRMGGWGWRQGDVPQDSAESSSSQLLACSAHYASCISATPSNELFCVL